LSIALFLTLTAGAIVYWRQTPDAEVNVDPDPALGAAAEDAFQQGIAARTDAVSAKLKFAQAADLYSQLIKNSPSPSLFLNLGNASLLADRLPEAIFAYQRGLQIFPDDEALRRHLSYARALVAYGPSEQGRPADDAWPLWLPTPRTLLHWGVLAAYAFGLFFLVRTWMTRRCKPFLFACLSAVAFLFLAALPHFFVDDRPSVVIARDVPLRLGNAPSYPLHPELPLLARGMEAHLIAARGDWIFLQLSTGQLGWVPADAANQIGAMSRVGKPACNGIVMARLAGTASWN